MIRRFITLIWKTFQKKVAKRVIKKLKTVSSELACLV